MLTRKDISQLAGAFSAFAHSAGDDDLELVRDIWDSIEAKHRKNIEQPKRYDLLLERIVDSETENQVDLPLKELYGNDIFLHENLGESDDSRRRNRKYDSPDVESLGHTLEELARGELESARIRELELSERKSYSLEELARGELESARIRELEHSERRSYTPEEMAWQELQAGLDREARSDLPRSNPLEQVAHLPVELEAPSEVAGQQNDLRERVQALLDENAQLRAEIERLSRRLNEVSQVETNTNQGEVREVVEETRTGLEDLQEVDLTKVELFAGRPVNPWDHLRLHYGRWLRMYNNERDMITLDMIRVHDQKLVEALQMKISRERAKAKREGGTIPPTLAELITTEDVARSARLEQLGIPESLFRAENRKIAMALYSLLHRHLFRSL